MKNFKFIGIIFIGSALQQVHAGGPAGVITRDIADTTAGSVARGVAREAGEVAAETAQVTNRPGFVFHDAPSAEEVSATSITQQATSGDNAGERAGYRFNRYMRGREMTPEERTRSSHVRRIIERNKLLSSQQPPEGSGQIQTPVPLQAEPLSLSQRLREMRNNEQQAVEQNRQPATSSIPKKNAQRKGIVRLQLPKTGMPGPKLGE